MNGLRKLGKAGLGIIAATMASAAVAQPVPVTEEQEIIVTGRPAPDVEVVRRLVPIGDLNLTTADGQRVMEQRVGEAVRSMCAIATPLPGYELRMNRSCREEAWASAGPQMAEATDRQRWFGSRR